MLDFKSLEAFVAVAEELHFGRAAQRLHLAQPPVSQRIRALEGELDVKLFERTTRSVRLTPAGEVLLGPARQLLRDLEDAEMSCRAAGTGAIGRVSIGFGSAPQHSVLPKLTQAVRSSFPGIELSLHGQTYANVAVDKVGAGTLDLGFTRLPVSDPRVSSRAIGAESLVCALPANHPLVSERSVDLKSLEGEPFVVFPPNRGARLRDEIRGLCRAAGFEPNFAHDAPDSHTILALVAAGAGVALTMSSVRHVQQAGIAYRPLSGKVPVLYTALVWRTDATSPALRRVLEVADSVLPTVPVSKADLDLTESAQRSPSDSGELD